MNVNRPGFQTILDECVRKEAPDYELPSNTLTGVEVFGRTRLGLLLTTDVRVLLAIAARSVRGERIVSTCANHLVVFSERSRERRATLVVVPPLLALEFRTHGAEVSTTAKMFTDRIDEPLHVITDVVFRRHRAELSRREYNRVIMYNCGTHRALMSVHADFYWLSYSVESELRRAIALPTGVFNAIVARDDPVDDAPAPVIRYAVEYYDPGGFQELIARINSDHVDPVEIDRALTCMEGKHVLSEDRIVKTLVREIDQSMSYIDESIHLSDRDPSEGVTTRRAHLEEKRHSIVCRVTNKDRCFVCLDEVKHPCVMRCCSNKACFTCIHKWLSASPTRKCPLCNRAEANVLVMRTPCVRKPSAIDERSTMYENLHALLHRMSDADFRIRFVLLVAPDRRMENVRNVAKNAEVGCATLTPSLLRDTAREATPRIVLHNWTRQPYPVRVGDRVTDIVMLDDLTPVVERAFLAAHPSCARMWHFFAVT